jgi:hypothetical protein
MPIASPMFEKLLYGGLRKKAREIFDRLSGDIESFS